MGWTGCEAGLWGGASALGRNGMEEWDGAQRVEDVRPGRVAKDMVH